MVGREGVVCPQVIFSHVSFIGVETRLHTENAYFLKIRLHTASFHNLPLSQLTVSVVWRMVQPITLSLSTQIGLSWELQIYVFIFVFGQEFDIRDTLDQIDSNSIWHTDTKRQYWLNIENLSNSDLVGVLQGIVDTDTGIACRKDNLN